MTAIRSPDRALTSDRNDPYPVIEAPEILAIARIEIQSVGVRRGSDEQIGQAAAWAPPVSDDGRDDEPVAAGGRGIEGRGASRDSTFWRRACRRAASGAVGASSGPAASSADVITEMAKVSGRAPRIVGSCQSMTTEVSSRPVVSLSDATTARGPSSPTENDRIPHG